MNSTKTKGEKLAEKLGGLQMKLQVFLDNQWQFVLSQNSRTQLPVPTTNKDWAIDAEFLNYYQVINPTLQFRVV